MTDDLKREALRRAYNILQHETTFEVKESKMDVFVLDLIDRATELGYQNGLEEGRKGK